MLKEVHKEATGQVTLYQNNTKYEEVLTRSFGSRFIDYRRRWQSSSRRELCGDFPLSLDLAINSGCQLRCSMCPMAHKPRPVRFMNEALFHKIMDEAREHALPAMTLGLASEPLLNKKAPQLIAYAVKSGVMDIRLGSNGLMLNEQLLVELIESGLTRLEISVDAVQRSTYEAIRGGDLDLLERKIELFLNKRNALGSQLPLLRLSFLELEENKHEMEAFINRWEPLADMLSIQKVIWFPGSALPKPDKGSLRPQAPLCSQSWQRLGIDYDGHVWPCCSWYGENILKCSAAATDLAYIWRLPALEDLRQSLSSGDERLYPSGCRECSF